MLSGSALQSVRRLWYRIPRPTCKFIKYFDFGLRQHLVMRMVVPGWPQWYFGQKHRAELFLFWYLVCLFLGIWQSDSVLGPFCVGFAIACHASSIADIVIATIGDLPTRILTFIRCATLVAVLVYLPGHWLISSLLSGTLIVHLPEMERQILLVDRVLATEGQHVEWRGDDLKVNGQPIAWRPLLPVSPQNLSLTVPRGQLLIAPSTILRLVPPESAGQVWQSLSLVNREYVRGNAYWRLRPFGQFGPLR